MMPPGIYVHLPFCPYICPYCDFPKWAADGNAQREYLRALYAEITLAPAMRAETLFIGGGTPNTYDAAEIAALVDRLRERFCLPAGAEITIEINPDLERCEGFEVYRSAGISRLSIGVQSFDAKELRVLGRRHSAQNVRTVVARARAAGFENISIDLIFGVPGQTMESWAHSLDTAVGLDVEHCSTYGLTVEPGTPYERWFARAPECFASDVLEADLYGQAIECLCSAGYEQYEISNFARQGFRSVHNANYWANGDYLGLGVGAASYRSGIRSVHTRDRQAYIDAVLGRRPIPGDAEQLVGARRAGEAIMLALRTAEGVELAGVAERYNVEMLDVFREELAQMQELGLIDVTPTHVRLTLKGRFVANEVAVRFIAAP